MVAPYAGTKPIPAERVSTAIFIPVTNMLERLNEEIKPQAARVSRKGTRWDQVLFVLPAYRLLAPGSEGQLHRKWFERSALADLLGQDAGLAEIHKLYRCHHRLLTHKQAVFDHLWDGGEICSTSATTCCSTT